MCIIGPQLTNKENKYIYFKIKNNFSIPTHASIEMHFVNVLMSLLTVSRVSTKYCCPQRHNARIPIGTDTETLQYIMDGISCTANLRISESKTILLTALADIKIVYNNAVIASNGSEVSAKVDQIINYAFKRINSLSKNLNNIERKLLNNGLRRLRKTANGRKSKIVSLMIRARKIIIKKNYQIQRVIANNGQLVIENVLQGTFSIVKSIANNDFVQIRNDSEVYSIFQSGFNQLEIFELKKVKSLNNVMKSIESA